MTCPHCGGAVSRFPQLSPAAKRRVRMALAVIAAVAVILTAVWLLWPPLSKEAIIGTWRMQMPVGKVLGYFAQSTEENTLAESMLSMLREEQAVTVYCRFFDNDTYEIYADADEVIAVADKALDTAVAYVCEEGIGKAVESGELSGVTTSLLLGVANASSEELTSLFSWVLDKVMPPLYDKLREAMAPSEVTGRYRYVVEDERVFMSMQKDVAVENSAYVIWQYDDGTLRMVSGSFLDGYLGGLVWEKLADS